MSSSTAAQRRRIQSTAREAYGWARLREGQLTAVEAVLEGRDTLVVMPSGGGKSAIYQVAALLLGGPTVVISPLLALQRDQIESIDRSEAPDAVAVNSDQRASEETEAWAELRSGEAEFIFLTPEQLARTEVLDRLARAGASLLVVDEAHCVSAWGHDFRPDYLRIADARERIGDPTVLALTATAAPPVRAEIMERLAMRDPVEVVRGFDRPNLHLAVRQFADDYQKRGELLEWVAGSGTPALVYVGTRKDTDWYAGRLAERGLRAVAYHAGQKRADRERTHDAFQRGDLDVVVATSAFGMGIDKADVRTVAHAHIPESLDAYYQEIGRGGRDGDPARVQLFYRAEDLGLRRFFGTARFDEDAVRAVLGEVREEPARIAELVTRTGLTRRRVTAAVSLLEGAAVVEVGARREVRRTQRHRPDGRSATARAVAAARQHADQLQEVSRSRLEMMRGYAETTDCRRRFLLGYFGEQLEEPCGSCDNCDAGLPERTGEDSAYGSSQRVHHSEFGAGVVMHAEQGVVTVLFDEVGYKTLDEATVTESGLLKEERRAATSS